jgi:hypothetical protein
VTILGATDVAFLEGCRPVVQRDDRGVIDALLLKELADEVSLAIVPDAPDEGHLGTERSEHRGHARRPAEPMLAMVGSQERDRGFLADALGIAPDIAVEDQVSDHQDAGVSQRLYATDQVEGHAAVLLDR